MINIDDVLSLLHEALSPVDGEWMIIGTSSLYISGYPVSPNDIDILADDVTTKEIEIALAAYRLETSVTPDEKFRSRFSKYNFNNFNVEVMGALEVNTANGWVPLLSVVEKVIMAHYKDKAFRIPSQADQLRIYTLFNRAKDEPVLQMLRHR